MRLMKVKAFFSMNSHKELADFVNQNKIEQKDIVTITHFYDVNTLISRYTLFYYSD